MRPAIAALLPAAIVGACAPSAAVRPSMVPVDTPRPPKGTTTTCSVEFEPITLPTTAAEQVEGRQRDRVAARAAIETCDGRRSRAVRHIRRQGAAE